MAKKLFKTAEEILNGYEELNLKGGRKVYLRGRALKMGFTENEVTEHMKVFTDTILRKGGTYASVNDYFREIIKTSKMYPRADGECNIVPVEVVSVGDMTEGN